MFVFVKSIIFLFLRDLSLCSNYVLCDVISFRHDQLMLFNLSINSTSRSTMQKSNKLKFNFLEGLEHNPCSAVVCDIPLVNCSCKLGFRFRQKIRLKLRRPITFEICGQKHLHPAYSFVLVLRCRLTDKLKSFILPLCISKNCKPWQHVI